MPQLRDAILAKKKHERKFADRQIVGRGQVVKRDGSVDVPGLFDHLWVLPHGENGETVAAEPLAIYDRHGKARNRPGLWVVYGYEVESDVLEVLSVDISTTAGFVPTAGLGVPIHGSSHKRDGDDPTDVDRRMFVDGLHCAPGGGLSVNVSPLVYHLDGHRVIFGGYNGYDLTAGKPAAGLARWVLVSLNTATNSLVTTNGATASDIPSIPPTKPDCPLNHYPSAWIRLDGSQTSVVELDINDAREFIGRVVLDLDILKVQVFS